MSTSRSSRLRGCRWLAAALLSAVLSSAAAADERASTPDNTGLGDELSRLYGMVRPAVVSVVSFRMGYDSADISRPEACAVSMRRLVASGIVVGDRGTVVTAARAAQPGDSILIHFPGGPVVAADYAGMDPSLHIAVLRLREQGSYSVLPVFPAMTQAIPDWVAAVAYGPWKGEQPQEPVLTLSPGLAIETVETRYLGAPVSLWRLHAPVSPGNAGGALVTLGGRWLGLITGALTDADPETASPGRVASRAGAGVIVPAEIVMHAVAEIESGRRLARGFLGVRAERAPGGAPETSTERPAGITVVDVLPGSPAFCAGIRPGDVITHFAGREVLSATDLTQLVRSRRPGERVAVVLLRGAASGEVRVCLGDQDASSLYLLERREAMNEKTALESELLRLRERHAAIERRLATLGALRPDSAAR